MENLHLKNLTEDQILKHPYFKNFSERQLDEIKTGMQNKINYWNYAKININPIDMAKIREDLEIDKYGEVKKRTSTTQILTYLINELNRQSQEIDNRKTKLKNTQELLKGQLKISKEKEK